jgi:wyosine [tRNA(Phe)-imidazoG37] synthetase (radical SAM superfamily)
MEIAFGPVPSRRLGRSLGINNVPPKHCTYACVYCQLGRTPNLHCDRRAFLTTEEIIEAVSQRLRALEAHGKAPPDYVTFVPDGETTLDQHLDDTLAAIGALGVPIAVISNASLMDDPAVREALGRADWVSLKVDAVHEEVWRAVDRPHGRLQLDAILDGIASFAGTYQGILATETMLVRGVNDGQDEMEAVAETLAGVGPATAYLAIPTRPPAEPWVLPPAEAALHAAYQTLAQRLPQVEWLVGYEGNAFASTGDTAQDLLQITAVHPMRHDAVIELLERNQQDWQVVDDLLASRRLLALTYGSERFYLRPLARRG